MGHISFWSADDNLLGGNINVIKKKTEALLDVRKEVSQEVNVEKFMAHHQTIGQNHYINVANISFENVAKLKYLGMTVINENCIHKEIKSISSVGGNV
jgi:hypothetical protein